LTAWPDCPALGEADSLGEAGCGGGGGGGCWANARHVASSKINPNPISIEYTRFMEDPRSRSNKDSSIVSRQTGKANPMKFQVWRQKKYALFRPGDCGVKHRNLSLLKACI
jgi:hypothetical protein